MIRQLNASLAGRYAIHRELGAGGMAVVFLAEDLKHRRPVAIKVPYAERFGLFERGRWVQFHAILREIWLPFLQGEGSLEHAIDEMVKRL